MWLHGLLAIRKIRVCIGGRPSGPTLADSLIHPFLNFGPQIVAAMQRDSSHHVEGQYPRRVWTKLANHDGELSVAFVFKFLKTDGVTHLATHTVELIAQNRTDAFASGDGLN